LCSDHSQILEFCATGSPGPHRRSAAHSRSAQLIIRADALA